MKKTKLLIDYDFGFILIGITTTSKDYKLAWILNKRLQFNLSKQEDLHLPFEKGQDLTLSHYLFTTDFIQVHLVKNKSVSDVATTAFLVPELNHFDYFLKIEEEGEQIQLSELLQTLRSVEYIQLVQQVDINKLKSKENLIF